MCLKTKISVFLPLAWTETVSGLTMSGGEIISSTRLSRKSSKIAAVTKSAAMFNTTSCVCNLGSLKIYLFHFFFRNKRWYTRLKIAITCLSNTRFTRKIIPALCIWHIKAGKRPQRETVLAPVSYRSSRRRRQRKRLLLKVPNNIGQPTAPGYGRNQLTKSLWNTSDSEDLALSIALDSKWDLTSSKLSSSR